jgi:large subunit ribosomal protein L24
MPVHISNVALVDPKTKKRTGIAYQGQKGEKVRVAKASKTVLS